MTRARKQTERFCLIAPALNDNSRRWFDTEAAATEAAKKLIGHSQRRGVELVVVKAVALVTPKKPVVPVDVSTDFSQLELAI